MIITDISLAVIPKLGNRTDLGTDINRWIKESILELAQSYAFEELRVTGPDAVFHAGVAEYPVGAFLNSNLVIPPPPPPAAPPVPDIYTQIVSWIVELDTSSHISFELKYRAPAVVMPMTKVSGIPCRWTRLGANFIIGFKPDKDYATKVRYQRQHPFPAVAPNELGMTTVLMPDDWADILAYAAAERGAIERRMLDYASSFHNILYGDPEFAKSGGTKGAPGLIFKRVSQMERDMSNNERQLVPVVQKY